MGGELVACVRMMTSQLVVEERVEQLVGPASRRMTTVPGMTWNLNQRNNQMCRSLAANPV